MKRLLALLLGLALCFALLPAARAESEGIVFTAVEGNGTVDLELRAGMRLRPAGFTFQYTVPEGFTCSGYEKHKMLGAPILNKDLFIVAIDTTNTTSYIEAGEVIFTLKLTPPEGFAPGKYPFTVTFSEAYDANLNDYDFCKSSFVTVYEKLPSAPVITTDPADLTIAEGKTATFTVAAEGELLRYQWQYRKSSNGEWKNSTSSGNRTDTLTLEATSARNNFQFRCVVSNPSGETASAPATLRVVSKPVITTQPQNVTVYVGNTVKFSLKASNAETYQWYYCKNTDSAWTKSKANGSTSAALTLTAKSYHDGYQYRCLVKNIAGKAYSNIVTLSINPRPEITAQPQDASVYAGNTVTLSLRANNADSYQWYFRKNADYTWTKSTASGSTTDTLTMTAKSYHDGWQYRCLVKNASGTTYSRIVTLQVEARPEITVQPVSASAAVGGKVSFHIEAKNADSYQWYFRKNADSAWTKSTMSGNTTDTLTVTVKSYHDGYQYRCIVRNEVGPTHSDIVTLTLK